MHELTDLAELCTIVHGVGSVGLSKHQNLGCQLMNVGPHRTIDDALSTEDCSVHKYKLRKPALLI